MYVPLGLESVLSSSSSTESFNFAKSLSFLVLCCCSLHSISKSLNLANKKEISWKVKKKERNKAANKRMEALDDDEKRTKQSNQQDIL
jgi:hypothetical protein